jgi:hypothetical protein
MVKKLNLDKLKNNLARLSGERPRTSRKSIFWTPQLPDGETSIEYKVYLLPWPDQEDYPFKELWFYYALGGQKDENGRFIKAPLTLKQFGEPDPVQASIDELWDSTEVDENGVNQDKELAKKLFASQTAYIPLIVEGEEELGPRLWKFSSSFVHKRLTELFMKYDDYGVLNDPDNARWLTVSVVHVAGKKKPMNKKIGAVDPEFKNRPLSEDPEQIEKWLNGVPELMEAVKWQRHDYAGLQKLLENFANSATPTDEEVNDSGTEHHAAAEAPSKEPAPKKKGHKSKKSGDVMSTEEAKAALEAYQADE